MGMDDLLLHLTGGVELSYLKEQQEKVKRGEPIARITQEGKELVITSPISGEIDKVHTSLADDSGAINKDPYSSWLYKINPEKWREETHDALMSDQASDWVGKELERFRDYMAEEFSKSNAEQIVLQEGGELSGNPLKEMNSEAWQNFQKKFLDIQG